MIEECFCCGAHAPSWEADEYAEWVLELEPDGGYLGVVCPGCFAGNGVAFVAGVTPRRALRVVVAGPGRGMREAGQRLADAA